MLSDSPPIVVVPTTDAQAARPFYEDVLGLTFVADDGFALVFDAGGTTLRIPLVQEFQPQPFTVLGWQVDDVENTVKGLAARGVQFERFPGMDPDEHGIWKPMAGAAGVAWFKDPDGNLLSVSGAGG